MTRAVRIRRALALALLFAAKGALADDTDDIRSLLDENVITTASTTAEKASRAPSTSVTITAEELRLYGLRTIDEAVRFLSVGVVTSDPLRTPDIGSRGVLVPGDDGKHFLLLVNGHTLNDPLYGAARFDQGAGIPIDVVDHLEVIVGPGSVLYGSNAMLGVINVITKNGRDYSGGHVLGDLEPGRSVRAGAGAGMTFRLFGQDAELTTSAEYFERYGPDVTFQTYPLAVSRVDGKPITFSRNGSTAPGIWGGTVRNAYYTKAPSGMIRLRAGDFEINLLASAYKRGIPYTTSALNVDFDDHDSYELDRAVHLDVRHEATLSSLVQLTSRLYGDSFDYQRSVNRDASAGCFREDIRTCEYYDAGLARWAGVEERVSLNWLGDSRLVTLLGVDFRMRSVSAKQDSIDHATGAPFAPTQGIVDAPGSKGVFTTALVSPYVQQTWSPIQQLDVSAGARLDADPRFSPIVSPRGALAWSPYRNTTFRAIYSQAFRAPTWIETDASATRQLRSKTLEPETVRSIEANVEQRFATHRLMFGVFRSYWRDLIEPHVLSQDEVTAAQRDGELPLTANYTVRFQNIASLENYGWNGALGGTFADGKLHYGLNATEAFTKRNTSEGSQPLPVAPQLFGNVHVGYVTGGYVPSPALALSYVGRRPIDRAFSDDYDRTPYAKPLAELRVTISGRAPGVRGLSYGLTGSFVTTAEGPYSGGIRANSIYPAKTPVLVPTDEARIFFGLRYDFLESASSRGDAP